MTSDNANLSDRAEIIRLARLAAVRAASIIIQSRDGNKAFTKCNPYESGHATFNLSLPEVGGEVDKSVKKAMNFAGERWSLYIEVFLKTQQNEVLTLEMWTISLTSGSCDHSPSCRHLLAGRFCILLKALLTTSRAVPAYHYSRHQISDCWTINYNIISGEPSFQTLGPKFKHVPVGTISTPVGSFQVALAHRTDMTISSQPSGINTSLILKSDHFRPDFSPKRADRRKSRGGGDDDDDDDNISQSSVIDEAPKMVKIGAFVNSRSRPESAVPSEDDDPFAPNTMPFGSLLNVKTLVQQEPEPEPTTTNEVNGNELCERLNAVQLDKDDASGNVPDTKSVSSCNDDYIVVDLGKSPFAEPGGNIRLGTCYQEWDGVPHSPTPSTGSNVDPKADVASDTDASDQLSDLSSQLEDFETNLEEFDDAISSMYPDDSSDQIEDFSPLET